MRPGGRMSFYCCFKKLLLLNHLLGFTIGILYDVNLATLHVCNLLTSHVVDSLHAVWQGEGLNVLDASGIVFKVMVRVTQFFKSLDVTVKLT